MNSPFSLRLFTNLLLLSFIQILPFQGLLAQEADAMSKTFHRELIADLYESDFQQVFKVHPAMSDDEINNMEAVLSTKDVPLKWKVKRGSSGEIVYFKIRVSGSTCVSDDFGSALIIKSKDGKWHCSIRPSRNKP